MDVEIPATDAGTSRTATGTRHGHARQPLKAVRLPFAAQVFSQLALELVYTALPERLPSPPSANLFANVPPVHHYVPQSLPSGPSARLKIVCRQLCR